MGIASFLAFTILALAAGYAALLVGLRANENRLLLHPRRKSPDMGAVLPHQYREWMLQERYAGFFVEPVDEEVRPLGTVLIFHGNAGTAEGRLPLAARFASLGYRAVVVEYPGFGRRSGRPTLEGALEACKEAFYAASEAWPGALLLLGESLGAGMAGQVLRGNESRVAAAIFATPWDSLSALARAKLPFVPVERLLQFTFDTAAAVSQYTEPVVVIASQDDTLIPVRHARRLAKAAQTGILLELEAGHNDWYKNMSDMHWDDLKEMVLDKLDVRA